MRKKIIAAFVTVAVLIACLGTAFAAAGTSEDPFVLRSYLSNVFGPDLQEDAKQLAKTAMSGVNSDALSQLDSLSKCFPSTSYTQLYADKLMHMTLSTGSLMTLSSGSSMLMESGQGTLTIQSGTLIDATTGFSLETGSSLAIGHYYIAAEQTNCTLTITSTQSDVSVQGFYQLIPFTDVDVTTWYYSPTLYVFQQGLFNGISPGLFSPNTNMTRAMLATVLHRIAGAPEPMFNAGFFDTPSNAWYITAVNWAAREGIINGVGDNLFAPDSNVTREQAITMLYRYAVYAQTSNLSARSSLSSFSDGSTVSQWAQDAMSWAVATNIITGRDNGTIDPAGFATRAELATMIQRFCALL